MRALTAVLLLAACKSAPEKPQEPSPGPPPAENPALDDAQWRAEAKQVIAKNHLALAKKYRDALDLDPALSHVDQALLYEPTNEEAIELRNEIQRLMGERAGEVSTIMEDEWLARQAREEQRLVEAQHALDEAKKAEAAGDFERATTLYKRAAYLAREK